MQVVIVDDQPLTRLGLQIMVHWDQLGLSLVGEASNGKEAIDIIQECQPDILITDVRMPLINGLELADYVHRHYPSIKTIIVSGYDDFNYVKSAMRSKALDYILKPINEEELNQTLLKAKESFEVKEDFSEVTWSYPLDLEKELVQSLQWGELHNFKSSITLFFKQLESANITSREAKLWIGQLVLQVCKALSAELPADMVKQGFILAENLHTKLALQKITTEVEVEQYFSTVAHYFHKHKNMSHENSILLAKNYIDVHFGENLTLNDLSSFVYMSPSQFSVLFKQIVGDNFINYLTNQRIEKSKNLLKETNITIDKIAIMVGYTDAGYFRKLFKRLAGMIPMEYRGNHK